MGKFHINKQGKMAECKADIKACPLGGLHIVADNPEQAQVELNKVLAKSHSILANNDVRSEIEKLGKDDEGNYTVVVAEKENKNTDSKWADIVNKPADFRYQLLGRMKTDCEYYLGNGNKQSKHLWATNEEEQIEAMEALYDSFDKKSKPEWLTKEYIENYKSKMVCQWKPMKKEKEFYTVDYYGTKTKAKINVELKENEEGKPVLSISGLIGGRNGTSGQCRKEIMEVYSKNPIRSEKQFDKLRQLSQIWDRWHLNDMNAGTPRQNEAIREGQAAGEDFSDYNKQLAYLEKRGLVEDNGYKYGSAWLHEDLPDDVIKFVNEF